MRNSWATNWGEDGYIRLSADANTCGLANEATSPRGAHRKDLPPHALGRAGPLTHAG